MSVKFEAMLGIGYIIPMEVRDNTQYKWEKYENYFYQINDYCDDDIFFGEIINTTEDFTQINLNNFSELNQGNIYKHLQKIAQDIELKLPDTYVRLYLIRRVH